MTTEEAIDGIKRYFLEQWFKSRQWKFDFATIAGIDIDLEILVNPTPQELAAAKTTTFRLVILEEVYQMLQYLSNILYDVVQTISETLQGPLILRLPSGLAWKIITEQNEIHDFRLEDRDFGWKFLDFNYHILLLDIHFILTAQNNATYHGIKIKGSENWPYYDEATHDVKYGYEFTPEKYYTEKQIMLDGLFVALVGVIIAALIHAGKNEWANAFGHIAYASANSYKTMSFQKQITNKLETIEADTSTLNRATTGGLENAESVTGKIKSTLGVANTIKGQTDVIKDIPIPPGFHVDSLAGVMDHSLGIINEIRTLFDLTGDDDVLTYLTEIKAKLNTLYAGAYR